ncbi:acyl-CoA dehydrogenase family protein [Alcanivorax sp.]|uniref:acyl-CoA dehydrogenase family protein n=1 Tax=Alcanivorax sp. TaxID=1872427 RepID=UPI003BAD9847
MSTPLFDLTLTEEQRITRESMRRLARDTLSNQARAADDAAAADAGLLDAISGFGLALMPMPEALGGVGMPRSPLSNALAVEDLAQGDMSHTLAALQPLSAVNALMDFADEQQQERWLPALASETFVGAAVALNEPRATFEPTMPATTARKESDAYTLNGVKSLVPMAGQCQWFVVIAATESEVAAFVVPADAPGLTIAAEACMGLRSANTATLTLENVRVPAHDRLPHFDLDRLLGLSRIGQCAMAVGCCQAVMEYAIPYVKERKAFGEPIAWRQSVAFMVANMGIEIEGMRLMMLRAASRAEQGTGFPQGGLSGPAAVHGKSHGDWYQRYPAVRWCRLCARLPAGNVVPQSAQHRRVARQPDGIGERHDKPGNPGQAPTGPADGPATGGGCLSSHCP